MTAAAMQPDHLHPSPSCPPSPTPSLPQGSSRSLVENALDEAQLARPLAAVAERQRLSQLSLSAHLRPTSAAAMGSSRWQRTLMVLMVAMVAVGRQLVVSCRKEAETGGGRGRGPINLGPAPITHAPESQTRRRRRCPARAPCRSNPAAEGGQCGGAARAVGGRWRGLATTPTRHLATHSPPTQPATSPPHTQFLMTL